MDYFGQSLTLQRSIGNKYGIARCLTSMSVVAYWQGDYARAAQLAYQSLVLQRELGDRLGVAYTLENLGMALFRQGDVATATTQMEECLSLFRAIGDKMGVVLALDNLGVMASAQGRIADAVHYHRESLTVAWQIREQRRIAFCFEGLATAAGMSERAVQLFASAATLRTAIDAPMLPSDRAEYEQQVSRLRAHLGEDSFAAAWQLGESRSVEQAVQYALGI
jgi:tetratricopeptide (TPR) repeat protein